MDRPSLGAQRADVERQAAQALATNDNRTAEAISIEAARLDRDPKPKIGPIATALERRGEITERGDFRREIVASNLDRFRLWLVTQRARLGQLWARAEKAVQSRQREAQDRSSGEPSAATGAKEPQGYTQEERDRLLGRGRRGRALDDQAARTMGRSRPTGRVDDRER